MGEIRQHWYWYKFQCQQCGADAKATRKDAKFCGATCRNFWHRAHKPTEAPKPTITNTAAELIKAMAKPKGE